MKSKLIATIFSVAIASCLFAQDEDPGVRSQGQKKMKSSVVSARFARLKSQNAGIKNLATDLTKKGFKAETETNKYYGFTETYQHPNGKTATLELVMQDYKKQGSKDLGALGMVKMVSGENSEIYSFSLIAQDGNFDKVSENRTDKKGDIQIANSWWSCLKNRVRSKCTSVCISALTTCPPTSWTVYLGCVIARCGWCATKALACCGCDCSWWCKWGVGCCDR